MSLSRPMGWKYRYAYATSQTMLASGGGYFAPYPGYFSSNSFSISDPVSEWAELTLEDLHEIDYSCVYVSTSYSDTMDLADTHTIICLRQSPGVDYHYMRLNGDHWYHKPANTHVLRYLHLPYEKDWSNECSYDGIVYPGVIFYTGTIYYFAFAEDHSYGEPLYTGNNYHQGKRHYFEYVSNCEDCGNAIYTWTSEICSGPPCEIDVTAVDDNQHIWE